MKSFTVRDMTLLQKHYEMACHHCQECEKISYKEIKRLLHFSESCFQNYIKEKYAGENINTT